jgi:hypothetical protein
VKEFCRCAEPSNTEEDGLLSALKAGEALALGDSGTLWSAAGLAPLLMDGGGWMTLLSRLPPPHEGDSTLSLGRRLPSGTMSCLRMKDDFLRSAIPRA